VPFTVSHAALAWPISRVLRHLPLAALVIGTMSPDYEYLVRCAPASYFSHTLFGVFAFCVPVSIAAWLIYRWLIEPSWKRLLPPGMRARLDGNRRRLDVRTLLLGTVAATLGAFSHLVWDAFTHREGIAVSAIPALQKHALAPNGSLRWYQVSQHGSTALGLVLLFFWARRAWLCFPVEDRQFAPGQRRSLVIAVSTLALAATAGGLLNGARVWGADVAPLLAYAAVGAMDAMVALAIALGLVNKVTQARRD
jgi:hypothetical protein